MKVMNDVMFVVLECLVSIFVILLMRYVLPYLKMRLLGTIDEKVFEEILKAVKSVQQDPFFREQLGSIKKEEVITRVTAWANQHGISITQEQLSQLIETAVFTMKKESNE